MSRNFQFFFRNFRIFRRNYTKIKVVDIPSPVAELNLTICGANSKIGRLSALLCKRAGIFKNLILWDEHYNVEEIVQDDLNAIRTDTNCRVFCGRKGLVDAVSASRIIYICDNIQTNPDIPQIDLFKCNANHVRQIILYVSEFNPTAMVVIGTPCVTSLVPMAYEEMLKNDCDASKQIFGVARTYLNLVGATAKEFNPKAVYKHQQHGVVGGCDKDTCIPVFAHSDHDRVLSVPDFTPKPGADAQIKGEKDVVGKFQKAEEKTLETKICECNSDGCYMFNALAGFQFICNLAKALSGEKVSDYAFVKQKNPINYNERYLTCKVELNSEGLESTSIPELTPEEKDGLKHVESLLNSYIHAGEIYITGREQIPKHRKKIEKVKKEEEVLKKEEEKPEDVFCKTRRKPQNIVVQNT